MRIASSRGLGFLVSAAILSIASTARSQASFVDVTEAAGVSYLHHEGNPFPSCLVIQGSFCTPERMAGGAAVADVDGDGDLDLFATRLEGPNLLLCNRLVESGQATFEDCTNASGLDAAAENGNGASFGDLDGDGDPDLYVTAIATQRFYLFVNDGAGHFSEEAVARGAALDTGFTHLGFGVELGDFDGDGWLDIHTNEWGPSVVAALGGEPDHPVHMRLLRNRGAPAPGFFEDVTDAAGVAIPLADAWGFASALRDLDGDGHLDLAIASDFGTSKLFWNDGDGTFTEGGAAAGVATDENGMGSTLGDFDHDGDLDWFVTSIYDAAGPCPTPPCSFGASGNRFYRNEGARLFSDQTGDATSGLRNGGWGWGTALFDYDLDGDLDLAMTNGVDYPDTTSEDAFRDDPLRLWRNDGAGIWSEVAQAEGLADTRSGKGLLVFDYDADGDLDLFVVNNASTPLLYQNQARMPGGPHWLRVRVVDAHGADALGAHVTVTPEGGGPAQVREIGSTSQFLGWSDPAAHFGLGTASSVVHLELRVPGAASPILLELAANELDRTITVPEPPGAAAACALLALAGRLGSRRLRSRES